MSIEPEQVRRRAGVFVLVSLVVAGGTAWVGYQLVARHEARLEAEHAQVESVAVVVATKDLAPGVEIVPADIEVRQLPAATLPTGATFNTVDDVVGQVPRTPVLEGEAVRAERLEVGPGGLEARAAIEPGSRAVAVRVDAASAVGGLLEPGFCVDVIVTVRPETPSVKADWVTETILQDMRVVAVEGAGSVEEGSAARSSPRRELLVTLETGPEEAERLAMASSLGKLHLALRHADDHDLLEQRGPLVTNAMVGISPTSETAIKRRRTYSRHHAKTVAPAEMAEVIQGNRVDVESFDADGNKVMKERRGGR